MLICFSVYHSFYKTVLPSVLPLYYSHLTPTTATLTSPPISHLLSSLSWCHISHLLRLLILSNNHLPLFPTLSILSSPDFFTSFSRLSFFFDKFAQHLQLRFYLFLEPVQNIFILFTSVHLFLSSTKISSPSRFYYNESQSLLSHQNYNFFIAPNYSSFSPISSVFTISTAIFSLSLSLSLSSSSYLLSFVSSHTYTFPYFLIHYTI